MTSLLKEVLTPSELDLHYSILENPFNPASNPLPSRLQTRLTIALHALIYHLQDRISHMEDTLLPQLATALQHKTTTINNLSTELKNLEDQISDLQGVVDFGTRILDGCWAREYEVRETLADIRRNRLSSFPRWWRSRGKVLGDVLATAGQETGKLKDSELDALLLMAEQNLGILGEDRDDMIGQMERYIEVYLSSSASGRSNGS
ncbi:hypothetical protein BDU57DRAFT_522908 [Ampelomyces quisqualis]|uniref:Uncharacterized protein n=1 Tax=Ampelomyces quisqualis TaxID=50730 RepID=A0A6A5QED1_AMPQU|nr:hypothetical protein BDU57DRAFT_522908 [Ampelomyces quisqualis]